MNVTTKFNLGDTVWTVRNQPFQRIVKCTACESTGEIKIGDELFKCPKCDGQAKHPIWDGSNYFIYTEGEIGKIAYEITAGKWAESNSNVYAAFGDFEDCVEVKYMIDATGVGSGNVWPEEDLFASREYAQAFCDAKNGVLKEDEV